MSNAPWRLFDEPAYYDAQADFRQYVRYSASR
jgi:hypothetical protein